VKNDGSKELQQKKRKVDLSANVDTAAASSPSKTMSSIVNAELVATGGCASVKGGVGAKEHGEIMNNHPAGVILG